MDTRNYEPWRQSSSHEGVPRAHCRLGSSRARPSSLDGWRRRIPQDGSIGAVPVAPSPTQIAGGDYVYSGARRAKLTYNGRRLCDPSTSARRSRASQKKGVAWADNTRAHNHRSHGRAGDERAQGEKSVEAVLCVCRDAEGKIVECKRGWKRSWWKSMHRLKSFVFASALWLLRGVRNHRHAAVGVASRPAVHNAGHLGAHNLAAAGRRRQHAAQECRVGGRQERVAPRGRRRGGA